MNEGMALLVLYVTSGRFDIYVDFLVIISTSIDVSISLGEKTQQRVCVNTRMWIIYSTDVLLMPTVWLKQEAETLHAQTDGGLSQAMHKTGAFM